MALRQASRAGAGGALQRASCPSWVWFGPCELSDEVAPWMWAAVPGREHLPPCFSSSSDCFSPNPQNMASGSRSGSEFSGRVGADSHLPSPISCISRPPPYASPAAHPSPAFIPPTFLTWCCKFSHLLFPWVQKSSPEDLWFSALCVYCVSVARRGCAGNLHPLTAALGIADPT